MFAAVNLMFARTRFRLGLATLLSAHLLHSVVPERCYHHSKISGGYFHTLVGLKPHESQDTGNAANEFVFCLLLKS